VVIPSGADPDVYSELPIKVPAEVSNVSPACTEPIFTKLPVFVILRALLKALFTESAPPVPIPPEKLV